MKNVLITGNLGYVGSVLIPLLKAKYNVKLTGLDIGYFGHNLSSNGMLPECHLSVQYFKDIRKLDLDDLKGVDVLIHLAALSNDPIGNNFSNITEEINLQASKRLVQLCKRVGVQKLIFASSCSVYGAAGMAMKKEDSELNPLTAYARSKISFEEFLFDEVTDEFKAICLRFATACGPSPRLRLDLVLNDFVFSALKNGVIDVLSDGTPIRPLIDVRDMANAISWCIGADGTSNFSCFNVGRLDSNYTVSDIANHVAEILTNVDIRIAKGAQPDQRSYAVDFTKFDEFSNGEVLEHSLESSICGLRDQIKFLDINSPNVLKRLDTLKMNIDDQQLTSNLEIKNVL